MTLTNVEHESGPTLSRRRLIQLGAAGLLGTEFAVSRAAAEGPPCIGCNGQVVGSGYLLSTDGALPCLVDASWTSPGLVHFFDESGRISKSLNVPAGAYGSAAGGGLFRVGAAHRFRLDDIVTADVVFERADQLRAAQVAMAGDGRVALLGRVGTDTDAEAGKTVALVASRSGAWSETWLHPRLSSSLLVRDLSDAGFAVLSRGGSQPFWFSELGSDSATVVAENPGGQSVVAVDRATGH